MLNIFNIVRNRFTSINEAALHEEESPLILLSPKLDGEFTKETIKNVDERKLKFEKINDFLSGLKIDMISVKDVNTVQLMYASNNECNTPKLKLGTNSLLKKRKLGAFRQFKSAGES